MICWELLLRWEEGNSVILNCHFELGHCHFTTELPFSYRKFKEQNTTSGLSFCNARVNLPLPARSLVLLLALQIQSMLMTTFMRGHAVKVTSKAQPRFQKISILDFDVKPALNVYVDVYN